MKEINQNKKKLNTQTNKSEQKSCMNFFYSLNNYIYIYIYISLKMKRKAEITLKL